MLQYSRAVLCYETVLCAVIVSVLFEVSLSNIASPFKVHFFSEGWQGRTRIEIQALLRHACIMNSNHNIKGHSFEHPIAFGYLDLYFIEKFEKF